nr:uncharacterized protein LOC111989303 [Quercus suber]
MDSIITPYQNAFIKGRNISDNIHLAHEIINVIRKKRGRRDSFGVLKIDMSKAYDRVNWNFLKVVLNVMNFDSKWIKWIMEDTLSSYSTPVDREGRCYRLERQSSAGDWQLIIKLAGARRRRPYRNDTAYETLTI